MQLRNRYLNLSLAVSLALAVAVPSWAQSWNRQLAKGVTLNQQVLTSAETNGSAQIINAVIADPKVDGVRLQCVLAQDHVYADKLTGREVVSSMVSRLNAVAAVNGDFFAMGTPCGGDMLNCHVTGGELVSEPMSMRALFAVLDDGKVCFPKAEFDASALLADGRTIAVKGLNRPRGKNEVVLYTSRYYSSTRTGDGGAEVVIKCDSGLPLRACVPITGSVIDVKQRSGNTPIPDGCVVLSGEGVAGVGVFQWMNVGDKVTLRADLKSPGVDWTRVTEAIGGGPRLVQNGRVDLDAEESGMGGSFAADTHPRTAIGVRGDGKVVMVTVDGRQKMSGGMSLPALARVMKAQGCVEAINLDGGGSTTAATLAGILNSPSDGSERPVANGVAVYAQPLDNPGCTVSITASSPYITAGTDVQMNLVDGSGQPLDPEIASKAVWAVKGVIGFVDQSGRFHGFHAKKGSVVATIGSQSVSLPIEVIAGDPTRIDARMESEAPNRSSITASVVDAYKNPAVGKTIAVKVIGGVADQNEVVAGANGKATVGITWDAPDGAPAQVTLSCGTLPSVTLKR